MTAAAELSRSSPGAPKSQYGTPSAGMFGWLIAKSVTFCANARYAGSLDSRYLID